MSDGAIIVRQGTIEDYERAREVIAETFVFHQQAVPEFFRATDSPPPASAVIEELLRDGTGTWFLAEHAGQVVGFVTVRLRRASREPFLAPEVRAVVESLGILAQWRRHGIGRRLMEAVHAWAREQGARRVMLNVWEFNDGARALYEALGYATSNRNMWKAL